MRGATPAAAKSRRVTGAIGAKLGISHRITGSTESGLTRFRRSGWLYAVNSDSAELTEATMTMTDHLHFAILACAMVDFFLKMRRWIEARAQRKADAEYAEMLKAEAPNWAEFE
jgi:hypothetical protein